MNQQLLNLKRLAEEAAPIIRLQQTTEAEFYKQARALVPALVIEVLRARKLLIELRTLASKLPPVPEET